jgi:hypothetical protein
MRGAWLWPVFVGLTLADGFLLHALPPYDAVPDDLYGTTLLAGFANLAAVALVAPLVARRVRRRRPDLPKAIAENYTGTALVVAVSAVMLATGLAHRPAIAAEDADRAAQLAAVHGYVETQEPGFRRFLSLADTLRIDDDLYRTCVPGPDPKRPLCLVVSTDQSPPGVRRDMDRAPNSAYRVHGGFD